GRQCQCMWLSVRRPEGRGQAKCGREFEPASNAKSKRSGISDATHSRRFTRVQATLLLRRVLRAAAKTRWLLQALIWRSIGPLFRYIDLPLTRWPMSFNAMGCRRRSLRNRENLSRRSLHASHRRTTRGAGVSRRVLAQKPLAFQSYEWPTWTQDQPWRPGCCASYA